jgi:hypothetical protein
MDIDLKNYTGYFHDGSLLDIKHGEKSISIKLESAQLLPEWKVENVFLSQERTIFVVLYLEDIKNIKINRVPIYGKLKMHYDSAEIASFEIEKNKIILGINWYKFKPNFQIDYSLIEIEANKITWENQPEISDKIGHDQ